MIDVYSDPALEVLFFSSARQEGDCWEWRRTRDAYGYGQFNLPRAIAREAGVKRIHKAHRWAYEYMVGPIPDGLVIDHLCRNRACINPAHLEPVTHVVNTQRGEGGRKHQELCHKGHRIVDRPGMTRRCWTCHYERNRRRNRARG